MQKVYIVIGETEFYGPETGRHLVSVHDTMAEAETAAAAHRPNYDPAVGCARLSNNQASEERGVAKAARMFDYNPLHDWTLLPSALEDKMCAGLDEDPDADEEDLLRAAGWDIVEGDDTYYLFEI